MAADLTKLVELEDSRAFDYQPKGQAMNQYLRSCCFTLPT